MHQKMLKELELKLKAPLVAMERVAGGKHLPQIFAEVALSELQEAENLVNDLKKKQGEKGHD